MFDSELGYSPGFAPVRSMLFRVPCSFQEQDMVSTIKQLRYEISKGLEDKIQRYKLYELESGTNLDVTF